MRLFPSPAILGSALSAASMCFAALPAQQDDRSGTSVAEFLVSSVTVGQRVFPVAIHRPRVRLSDALLVSLHSSAASGTDGRKPTTEGLGLAIRSDPARWPFVVVFPQKPAPSAEWRDYESLVLAAVDHAERRFGTSRDRRILTGLDQGGLAALQMGSSPDAAERWAAIAPVAAGIRTFPERIPTWIFLAEGEGPAARALREALHHSRNGSLGLSVCDPAAMDTWDAAYRRSCFPEWVLVTGRDSQAAAALMPPIRRCWELEISFVDTNAGLVRSETSLRLSRGRASEGPPDHPDWQLHYRRTLGGSVTNQSVGVVPGPTGERLFVQALVQVARSGAMEPGVGRHGLPLDRCMAFEVHAFTLGGCSPCRGPWMLSLDDPHARDAVEALTSVADLLDRYR